jgi:hypothetical protein
MRVRSFALVRALATATTPAFAELAAQDVLFAFSARFCIARPSIAQ